MRNIGIDEALAYCEKTRNGIKKTQDLYWPRLGSYHPKLAVDFAQFLTAIKPYYDNVKMRFENNFFDIYLDNAAQFDELKTVLEPWLRKTYEPANTQELEYLSQPENCKKTVCNHLPYHRYQYRVNLRFAVKEDIKQNFISWAENYGEKIRIPPNAEHWFKGVNQWPWTPYIYAEDKHILSMVLMFLGNAVLSTEEYIPKVQINTTL